MPDYFDRLLGRRAPEGPAGLNPVRPRLPGPFERGDAVGAALPVLQEEPDAPRRAAVPVVAVGQPLLPEPAVRPSATASVAPRSAEQPVAPAASPARQAPLLAVPSVSVAPAPVVAPVRREAAELQGIERTVTVPREAVQPPRAEPKAPAAAPAAGPAVARRRGTAAPAQGAAVQASAGRRQQREPERVVRVQIGRVEVKAAERTPAAARRPTQAARPAPALDLEKYLNRGQS